MALVVHTAAADLAVSLEEAKRHCHIDVDDEDADLTDWIRAAVNIVQQRADRTLLTMTWRATADGFPAVMLLPRPPLLTVVSIKYIDTGGVQQTLEAAAYKVDAASCPARIVPAYGLTWPAVRREIDSVEVIYTAGYETPADVPPEAKAAIRFLVSHYYHNREPVNIGNITTALAETVDALVAQLWTGRLRYEWCD